MLPVQVQDCEAKAENLWSKRDGKATTKQLEGTLGASTALGLESSVGLGLELNPNLVSSGLVPQIRGGRWEHRLHDRLKSSPVNDPNGAAGDNFCVTRCCVGEHKTHPRSAGESHFLSGHRVVKGGLNSGLNFRFELIAGADLFGNNWSGYRQWRRSRKRSGRLNHGCRLHLRRRGEGCGWGLNRFDRLGFDLGLRRLRFFDLLLDRFGLRGVLNLNGQRRKSGRHLSKHQITSDEQSAGDFDGERQTQRRPEVVLFGRLIGKDRRSESGLNVLQIGRSGVHKVKGESQAFRDELGLLGLFGRQTNLNGAASFDRIDGGHELL